MGLVKDRYDTQSVASLTVFYNYLVCFKCASGQKCFQIHTAGLPYIHTASYTAGCRWHGGVEKLGGRTQFWVSGCKLRGALAHFWHGAFLEDRSATERNSKTRKACHSLSSESLFPCRAKPALMLCNFCVGLSSWPSPSPAWAAKCPLVMPISLAALLLHASVKATVNATEEPSEP